MSASPVQAMEGLLNTVVEALALDAHIEIGDDGETITGVLKGDELGLFIGRHGQTIDAVQHLAHRLVIRAGGERRVVVDAEGYRARRTLALTHEADRAAYEALRSSRPVALDVMTASERKQVHEHLRERGDVETYSQGDEPQRHLVVAPLGDARRFT
jgi:spoIIIJ-associated protein